MCLAVPARVMTIDNQHAQVDTMGFCHRVNIQLIEDVMPGDYVLVHAGFAIQKIDTEHYNELENIVKIWE
ncbi:MAG: HypC/HybG/HupF family hydrogenase formation chaperone [Christensenellales bacterium]|jgi:hydrogenase expression/formation protein HypC